MKTIDLRARIYPARDYLREHQDAIAQLHADTGTPSTSRNNWLTSWIDSYDHFDACCVAVGNDDEVEGLAVLAVRRRWGVNHVVNVGAGPSDHLRLPARDEHAAELLGDAIVRYLDTLRGPWRLSLRQLPPDDAVLRHLRTRLPWAVITAGKPAPILRAHGAPVSGASKTSHRRQVRKNLKRLRRDDRTVRVEYLRAEHDILAAMPAVKEILEARDVQKQRDVKTADPHAGPFFDRVIAREAAAGNLRLTLMWIDDDLAAYALCFVDGSTQRLWNSRLAPAYSGYGAGRLVIDEALQHAEREDGCDTLDLMRGVDEYKLSITDEIVEAVDLFAASSSTVGFVSDLPRRALQETRRLAAEHEQVEKIWKQAYAFAAMTRLAVRRFPRLRSRP